MALAQGKAVNNVAFTIYPIDKLPLTTEFGADYWGRWALTAYVSLGRSNL